MRLHHRRWPHPIECDRDESAYGILVRQSGGRRHRAPAVGRQSPRFQVVTHESRDGCLDQELREELMDLGFRIRDLARLVQQGERIIGRMTATVVTARR